MNRHKIYKKGKKPSFEIIQQMEVDKEAKSLNSISPEGVFSFFLSRIDFLYNFLVEFITCGKMNGCFGTSAYTVEDNINLQLYADFSRSNHNGTEWKRSSK